METEKLHRAFALMTEALNLLDEAGANPDIGAHLDVALNALEESLSGLGRSPFPRPASRAG